MRVSIFAYIFSVFLVFTFVSSEGIAGTIETTAKQAIILDFETEQVLFEKNADVPMPTSSMSKALTAYAVMTEIKAGNVSLDDKFHVSEKAWKMGGSKMFVRVDTKVLVKDLLRGAIIQSGNDSTIVLAEGIAGSEEKFTEYLNKIAQKIGMENSHFMNASGWPDPEHYSTARDLARLSYHIIKDFPEFYPYYAEKEFSYNNITQRNRNPLLSLDIGVDGIKTGHTELAGYGLMVSAVNPKDGRRVIVVINGTDSKKARAEEAEKLVMWGVKGFKNKKLVDTQRDKYTVPILYGKMDFVEGIVKDDLIVTIEKLSDQEFSSAFNPIKNIEAPIHKGDVLGHVEITKNNLPYKKIDVLAVSSVEELGTFKKFFKKIAQSISNRS